jgi:hypothetical protein
MRDGGPESQSLVFCSNDIWVKFQIPRNAYEMKPGGPLDAFPKRVV